MHYSCVETCVSQNSCVRWMYSATLMGQLRLIQEQGAFILTSYVNLTLLSGTQEQSRPRSKGLTLDQEISCQKYGSCTSITVSRCYRVIECEKRWLRRLCFNGFQASLECLELHLTFTVCVHSHHHATTRPETWLTILHSQVHDMCCLVLLVVISFHCALNVLLTAHEPRMWLEPRRTAHVVSTCAKRAYHPLARMQRIRDRVYKSKCILFQCNFTWMPCKLDGHHLKSQT